ncbi:MAG TPA: hypothetical protein VF245_04200 [Solirubrobacterales bacterium]
MTPRLTAELIDDRGGGAESEEFFRSRPFLDAESVSHTLRIHGDGQELLAPLIVREIEGGPERDGISPYGYPGFTDCTIDPPIEGSKVQPPIDPTEVDFSATGLVSAFVRHALGKPLLAAASQRNVVQIADPTLPTKTRGSDRNRINKNIRLGYSVRVVPGPETTAVERAGFLAAYEQTMRRTGAAERYFFGSSYFDRILESDRTWLAIAEAPAGEVAAASIAAASDGFLHYYLSGSSDMSLRDSPMKNVVGALVALSAEQALPLNLGGGISRGDRLEEFKRGFANREQTWHTSEIVCDADVYARLAGGRGSSGFFPAYREPLA